MFNHIPRVPVKMGPRPEKPPAQKTLSRRANLPTPTSREERIHFTKTGNAIVVDQPPVIQQGAKTTQRLALPSIKGHQKAQHFGHNKQAAQPPIFKGLQQTPSLQYAIKQQNEGIQTKETIDSVVKQRVIGKPPDKTPAVSPGAVVRKFKAFLTAHELQEINNYKEVWYWGQNAHKIKSSERQDTKDGGYSAIIDDHLAYRFQILDVIGTGFSSQVFKCMDHKTMENVAVKVFRNNLSIHKLGEAEVKILNALRRYDRDRSANVVHLKEKFYFRQHLCIIFDLFDEDLRKAVKKTKTPGFGEEEIRKYTIDVLKCLQLLKKNDIVHGDLKTDNVLLHKKGKGKHVAVCDYGGSYHMKHSDKPLVHTVNYMAPELLLGKRCGPAIDMWSLGCISAELHIGDRLFIGSNDVCLFGCIMQVLGVPPANLLAKSPYRHMFFDSEGLPLLREKIRCNSTTLAQKLDSKNADFIDFIERCLEYNPKKRMTPEQAMHHPWIWQKSKPAMSAGKTRSDVTGSSNKQPALLNREKITSAQLGKGLK
ncbi:dual specificity tyrosine-phosphorylation-regulated kinase 4-like isoform X2 [Scophthalmus maximus]|nr:dual specificity tyrosine-phosphorylation-regulated kinase 4-like isoform X2 [Scophthalmus maximus]XP_035496554.1 dual specificity tyrosine-phosphorylation-regulated kinase 4-like isoform X2 [Scophthalmus maximus]